MWSRSEEAEAQQNRAEKQTGSNHQHKMSKLIKDEHGERLEAGPSYDSEDGKEFRKKALRRV